MEKGKTKQVIVRLSPELHKQIKLFSVKTEKSINDIIVSFLQNLVRDNGGNANDRQQ